MAIWFHRQDVRFDIKKKRTVKKWLYSIIERHGFTPGDINIIFCSDEHLLEVNREWLNHDYFTDIITFNYNDGGVISGDLFISIDRVKDNATSEGVDWKKELHRVMAHGVLHLLHFGDKTAAEQKQMREKEEEALRLFKEMV